MTQLPEKYKQKPELTTFRAGRAFVRNVEARFYIFHVVASSIHKFANRNENQNWNSEIVYQRDKKTVAKFHYVYDYASFITRQLRIGKIQLPEKYKTLPLYYKLPDEGTSRPFRLATHTGTDRSFIPGYICTIMYQQPSSKICQLYVVRYFNTYLLSLLYRKYFCTIFCKCIQFPTF
jgi:hypothetical protein